MRGPHWSTAGALGCGLRGPELVLWQGRGAGLRRRVWEWAWAGRIASTRHQGAMEGTRAGRPHARACPIQGLSFPCDGTICTPTVRAVEQPSEEGQSLHPSCLGPPQQGEQREACVSDSSHPQTIPASPRVCKVSLRRQPRQSGAPLPPQGSQLRPPKRGGIRGGGASAAEGPWLPQAGLVVARFVCAVCFRQFLDRKLRRRAVNEEARWGAAWCGTAGVPSPGSAPGTPGLAPVENMAGRQVLALPMDKILWQGAETGPSWRPRLDGRLSPLPASFTCRQPRRTWPRAHCGSSRTEGPRRVLRCPLPGAHISCQPPKSPLWLGPARPQGWPDKGRAVSQEGLSLGPARGQLQASQAGRGPRAGGTRLPRVLGPGWAGARGLLHGVLAVPGGRAGRPHGCAESKQGLGWERMPVCPAPPRGSGLKKEGLLQAGAALEGSCRDRPPRPLVWLPQASSTLSAVLGKRVSGCLWGARVCMCVCA